MKNPSSIALIIITVTLLFPFSNVKAAGNVCNPISFNLPPDFFAGQAPTDVTKNDFDGDGIVDIAVSSRSNDVFSILKGDGDGGFFPPKPFFIQGFVANQIASGDFNLDGRNDVVVGNASANILATFLNDGQGGFSSPTIITAANSNGIFDLEVGDVNGDTFLDFVSVSGQQERELRIFLGDGQGNFTESTLFVLNSRESKIAVGNIDNIAGDDIVVYYGGGGTSRRISFVFGSTQSNFSIQFGFGVDEKAAGIQIAELNGNTLNDLAVSFIDDTQPTNPYFQPIFYNGGISFTRGTKYFSSGPSNLTTGDFNGDGFVDMAAAIANGSVLETIHGDGDGNFGNSDFRKIPNDSLIIFSADLNQNGKQDVGVITTPFQIDGFVSVLLSDDNRGFRAPPVYFDSSAPIAIADFNNDGFNDFSSGRTSSGTTSEIAIALNDTMGSFLPDQFFPTPLSVKNYSVGDFNGDGNVDSVTIHGNSFPRDIHVYLGDGNGGLSGAIETNLEINFDKPMLVGEFNSDGKDDVVAIDTAGNLYILLSDGDGTFTVSPNYPVSIGTTFTTFSSGDFNNDGNLDFIVAENSNTTIWLGDGTGQFARSVFSDSVILEIRSINLNGDNNLDLVAFGGGNVLAFIGDGTANFTENSFDAPDIFQSSKVVGDFNSDGLDDLAYTTFNLGNLVILPSLGGSAGFDEPIILRSVIDIPHLVGLTNMVAEDLNNDSKVDIVYSSSFRSVITNTSGKLPCLSIDDVSVNEGSSVGNSTAVFTVSLSSPTTENVRVNYSIESDGANLDTDVENVSGRLQILAGQSSATIEVPIPDDAIDEFDEEFKVKLASALNGSISDDTGIGTILDDDDAPSFTVADASNPELSGQSLIFAVNIKGQSEKPMSFRYTTADGTAVGKGDNRDYIPRNQVINVQANQTSLNLFVSILGDNIFELDENFFVNITEAQNLTITDNQAVGQILNNDSVPVLNLSGGSISEGDSGVKTGTLNVQLSNPTYLPVSINLNTGNISAVAGLDYVAKSDELFTIPAEQLSAGVEYQIIGDAINEPTESFSVSISNVQNANVGTTSVQVLIFDDENIANDFDGDGKTDIAIFRPNPSSSNKSDLGSTNSQWWLLDSSSGGNRGFSFGTNTDKIAPADFTGDGRTDIAFWRESTGEWFILRSEDSSFYSFPFGSPGDIPAPGDFDGDGKADAAVFRPSSSIWFINRSSDGITDIISFGISEDKPVVGDYDGDGQDDIAIFRPTVSEWWINRSRDGVVAYQFGAVGDKTVSGDYTGDGKADVAVWRKSTGEWFVLRSEDSSFYSFPFGLEGDIPVSGNYDGDSQFDTAIFRPSTNVWYINSSTNGIQFVTFGTFGDIPVQSTNINP